MENYLEKITRPKVLVGTIACFFVYAAVQLLTLETIAAGSRLSFEFQEKCIQLVTQLAYLCGLFVVLRAAREQRYFDAAFVVIFAIPGIGAGRIAATEGLIRFQRPEFAEMSLSGVPVVHGFVVGVVGVLAVVLMTFAAVLFSRAVQSRKSGKHG